MYERKTPQKIDNGVDTTFYVLGGKWKPDIILCIHQGIRRPSELQKRIKDASARVLSQQMSELENCGIIFKKVYAVVPLKVEYYLTEMGEGLIELLNAMENWGSKYKAESGKLVG